MRFDQLLEGASRTFALSIPFLPAPLRDHVSIGYLLLRIADTCEDSAVWSSQRRVAELRTCKAIIRHEVVDIQSAIAKWKNPWPTDHAGYRALLAEAAPLYGAYRLMPSPSRGILQTHIGRTIDGMIYFQTQCLRGDELLIPSIQILRHYCYCVAGIVGELLTELFLYEDEALSGVAKTLRSLSADFGEGLQLVNILKDWRVDSDEGRHFLSPTVSVSEALKLAATCLESAREYIVTMESARCNQGIIAFNAVQYILAILTLNLIKRGEAEVKLSRQTVSSVLLDIEGALSAGTSTTAIAHCG